MNDSFINVIKEQLERLFNIKELNNMEVNFIDDYFKLTKIKDLNSENDARLDIIISKDSVKSNYMFMYSKEYDSIDKFVNRIQIILENKKR